jgi:hypothetical protein
MSLNSLVIAFVVGAIFVFVCILIIKALSATPPKGSSSAKPAPFKMARRSDGHYHVTGSGRKIVDASAKGL